MMHTWLLHLPVQIVTKTQCKKKERTSSQAGSGGSVEVKLGMRVLAVTSKRPEEAGAAVAEEGTLDWLLTGVCEDDACAAVLPEAPNRTCI
jgi:hypothetical protein